VLITGSVKATVGLAMLGALPLIGHSTDETRTAVFLFESIAQLAYVYPSRALELRPRGNRVLNVIVVVSALLQPLLVSFPATRRMLALEPIDLQVWAILLGGVLISWLFAEVYCRRVRAKP
jgi:Ca2+-transporting ATPase